MVCALERFLRSLDFSSMERSRFERCYPDPAVVEKVMGAMGKLETLVVVDGDSYSIFLAMHSNPKIRDFHSCVD